MRLDHLLSKDYVSGTSSDAEAVHFGNEPLVHSVDILRSVLKAHVERLRPFFICTSTLVL